MFCAKCGKENNDDAVFCQSCGNAFKKATFSDTNNLIKKNSKKGCLTAFLIILGIIIIGSIIASNNNSNQTTTTTSTPVSTELMPLLIESITLKNNIIGVPELELTVKNTSDKDINTFSFIGECFNNYNEKVKGFGVEEQYNGIHQDSIIKSGQTSKINGSWQLAAFQNTTSIKIAIVKCSNTDGDIVEIKNPKNYIWFEGKVQK